MVSIVDNLLFLHRKIFLSQATPCVPHCENQKSLLSHRLTATQTLRLSNLIHILLFKLLSILHVHPWHSDLSLRLWGPWSLNVLTISFVFLWVRGPAHYENTQCYFSVGLPKTLFRDFGLLYENDKGEYVVLNDVRVADIRVASLVYLLVYVSTYCEPIALLRQNKPFRILYLGHAQIITEHFKIPLWPISIKWRTIWGRSTTKKRLHF